MRKICLLMFTINLMMACEKDHADLEKDCIEKVLKARGMVRYKNQQIGCSLFLKLYSFNESQYFEYGNHCADMLTYPFDCNGTKPYEDYNSFDGLNFRTNARYLGVIGIQILE
jgi:hypothetical protein